MDEQLKKVCQAFRLPGTYLGYEAIQVGIVNQTYKVNVRLEDGKEKSFLVQNVNTYAFRNPIGLMNNIDLVTEHIRQKCPEKRSLHFHHTEDRKTYLLDGKDFWRVMNYIPSATYSATTDPVILRNQGAPLGSSRRSCWTLILTSWWRPFPISITPASAMTAWMNMQAGCCGTAEGSAAGD